MREQTELIKTFINPTFLEAMKQPIESVECDWNYSFNIDRKGGKFHITLYRGKEGRVNISTYNNNSLGTTIIEDYCQTLDDFSKLIEKLDDMICRMPWIGKDII